MEAFSLQNKRILVTGASAGIGRACALALSEAGANLVLVARNLDALNEVRSKVQTKAECHSVDLAEEQNISELIDQIDDVDGIIHCAGIVKPFPVSFVSQKHMDEIQSINFNAPVFLTSQMLKKRKLKDNASIVFVSSISSTFVYKGGAMYTAFKAALETFSKTVALEYAHKGIRSNCIKAALVKTKVLADTIDALPEDVLQEHQERYLLGFGEPEDIANAVVFLSSKASKWITGTALTMDGGLTLGA